VETVREYRQSVFCRNLVTYPVTVKETDILVSTVTRLDVLTREKVFLYRGQIESYIQQNPNFLHSLIPWDLTGPAPGIIRDMSNAARLAGVGPMAAVAGAIAAAVGNDLLRCSNEVIIENGGDVFIKTQMPITAGIFAGKSPLSMKIGVRIDSASHPVGLCTSSGTVGHSLSFGKADAVCVLSDSCALADAAATAIGNRVRTSADIQNAIGFGKAIPGISGILIVVGSQMGIWGKLELMPITGKKY
jgi:hypothetical protein